eukprot:8662082-Alexandrium_andersonii.AAC.1
MARFAQAYTELASQVTARARPSKREALKQRLEDSAGGQAAMFGLFRKQKVRRSLSLQGVRACRLLSH